MVNNCETRPTECDGTCEYCPRSTKKNEYCPRSTKKNKNKSELGRILKMIGFYDKL